MNPYLVTYQLSCGHGIIQDDQDIILAPSEDEAKELFVNYLKKSLPDWKTASKIQII